LSRIPEWHKVITRGLRLRLARQAADVTGPELAERAGIDVRDLLGLERGFGPLAVQLMRRVADAPDGDDLDSIPVVSPTASLTGCSTRSTSAPGRGPMTRPRPMSWCRKGASRGQQHHHDLLGHLSTPPARRASK